jgi:hypothetical protein
VITRWGARRSLLGLACCALGAGSVLAGCGGSETPDPTPTTTTTTPTAPVTTPVTASASSGPTGSGPTFDCDRVEAAQDALDAAYAAELDRLGIGRGDAQAQSVLTLVTTAEGPAYYAAVLAAAPPELTPDAQAVLDYYQRLADRAGDLDAGSGSAEDLAAAMDRLDEATLAVTPDAGTADRVVTTQERLQAAVEQDCARSTPTSSGPADAPTGSTSPAG